MLKADAFKWWCKNMLNYRKFGCLATISFCLLKSSTRSLLHCYSIGSSQSCTQVSPIKFSGARLQIWTHFSSLAVSSASFLAYKAKRHGGKITLILLHNTQFWHDKWKPCNRIKPFQLSVFSQVYRVHVFYVPICWPSTYLPVETGYRSTRRRG